MCGGKSLESDNGSLSVLLMMLRGQRERLYRVQKGVDEANLVKVLAPEDVCGKDRICDADHLQVIIMLAVSS